MKLECTGIILAGGRNTRLPGKKKTFHHIGGVSMIERLHGLLSGIFTETLIVVNEPEDFAGLDAMVVTDIIPARCVLAGLHTGLFYASHPYAYVTACDIPFASEAVIRYLVARACPPFQVVIPRTYGGVEPLSAVYARSCLPLIEANLEKKIFSVRRFFKPRRVREIPVAVLEKLDPELRFCFNVNTPEDLATARQLADGEPPQPAEAR